MPFDVVAHIKWFEPSAGEGFTRLTPTELAVVVLVVSTTLALLLEASGRLDRHQAIAKLRPRLVGLESLAPLVVRLSTAAFLFVNTQHHTLLSPNISADQGALALVTTSTFLCAGLFLALGFCTRLGTIFLVVGYLMVGLQAPPIDVLDHVEYLGIAGYLWFRGPGPNSLDHLLGLSELSAAGPSEVGLLTYRYGVGMALAATALSEKVLNVATAEAFLEQYHWNVFAMFGLPDREFIIILGSVELALGLALAFGQASRIVVLVVLGAMLTTASLLGPGEVLGHIFAVGIVTAIWLEEPFSRAPRAHPVRHRLPRSRSIPISAS